MKTLPTLSLLGLIASLAFAATPADAYTCIQHTTGVVVNGCVRDPPAASSLVVRTAVLEADVWADPFGTGYYWGYWCYDTLVSPESCAYVIR